MLLARDNPFAVHRVLRERYRLGEDGWVQLINRLRALRWRGAIVGPHGTGKTTLLEDLCARLECEGRRIVFVRLSSEFRRLPSTLAPGPVGAGDFVAIDGAEQISWLSWRRLLRQARGAGGLVVTTHAEGRLPTLWRCSSTATLLGSIVRSLGVDVDDASIRALHARHNGNIREALRELYDRAGVERLRAKG